MKTKTCVKCGIEKNIVEFYKDNSHKDGLCHQCKICRRNYYQSHKQEIADRMKIYYQSHEEEMKECHRLYDQSHRRQCNERRRKRKKTDKNYKLLCNLRRRVCLALNGNPRERTTMQLLGCTISQLRKHIASQFAPGMTWKNHSLKGWHIDHIKPCALFDLSKPPEQRKCFHYTNLQPLWAVDNRKKGDKL